MSVSIRILFCATWCAATSGVWAQTLTDELVKESPSKLVLQARETGDIVRGAILFHQGNIACAKCHKPTDKQQRIGPALNQLGPDVSDESLVESILLPSKVIKPDYKTVRILTADGKVLNGSIVEQSSDILKVREANDVDKILNIERTEIETMVDGKISLMPAGLANELKSKQQFLDLLRYVLDLKERGPAEELKSQYVARRELSAEMLGHVLIRQRNCVACHSIPPVSNLPAQVSAPDLRWSAKHLNPSFIAKYIANPHELKPGTKMPQVLSSMKPEEQQQVAIAITHFLISLDGNDFHSAPVESQNSASIKQGFDLFHSAGCVACHSPRNENAVEELLPGSTPLGDISRKYAQAALTEFLKNPHAARPKGRMPSLQLTHKEATDLTSYLSQTEQSTSSEYSKAWALDPQLAAEGRELFKSSNCGACHQGILDDQDDPPAKTSLASVSDASGCLSDSALGKAPKFHLSAAEQSQILAAMVSRSEMLSAKQQIELSLVDFNCTSCHSRDNLGGVTDERSQYFHTSNLNLGEQGRIPPTLTGVGAKLKPAWMRDVLVNSRNIRPYMKTRMPQFGEENVGHLIELFQSHDQIATSEFAEFSDQKEMRLFGHELVGNKGLNCVACHTYQFKISDTMPAVDLTEMSDRLKKNWFYQYMLAPQAYSPNTVMPSFWPAGRSIRPDLAGTPEHQIEALWQYLLDGRQARAPRGVIREPLEIVVKDRARILRRSYPNIGKRGIGVGYPGGVNIAYDAEQMRLALLWKGQFADPSGVWYGQGHGRVRPMGSSIALAAGPELDNASSPWEVSDGRPPNHRFKGYQLDELRRPTFLYQFEDIAVRDFFSTHSVGESGDLALRRRIELLSATPTARLAFRLAAGKFAVEDGGKRVKSDRFGIQILSAHKAVPSEGATGQKAIVLLSPTIGESEELVLEYSLK